MAVNRVAVPDGAPGSAEHLSGKPIPLANEITAPYWQAAREGRLEIQRCSYCQRYIHPPEPYCHQCHSTDLRFGPVSGEGRVYAYTLVWDNATRGFEGTVPYVVAIVELKEQKRLVMVANIIGVAPEDVRVGMPVRLTFEPIGEGVMLPQFEPV